MSKGGQTNKHTKNKQKSQQNKENRGMLFVGIGGNKNLPQALNLNQKNKKQKIYIYTIYKKHKTKNTIQIPRYPKTKQKIACKYI